MMPRRGVAIAVVAALASVVIVRLNLAGTPLERDEGEYAYAGQLIRQGIPPYQSVYNMKFPGAYYAYAAIETVFGETPAGIHTGLVCVNVVTGLLVFAIGRRFLGDVGAATSTVAFLLLSLDPWTMGPYAHATHFVALAASGAWLLIWTNRERPSVWRLFGAGFLLGLAILVSQQAFLLAAGGLGLIIWSDRVRSPRPRLRLVATRVAMATAGLAVPLVLAAVLLAAQGVFGRFSFWTFQYARAYITEQPLAEAWPMFAGAVADITQADAPIWLLAAVGFVLLRRATWSVDTRVFLTAWIIAAAAGVCPGFYFRPHYFILLLPPVALVAGLSLVTVNRWLSRRFSPARARVVVSGLAVVVLGSVIGAQSRVLFATPIEALNSAIHQGNPFNESVEIAQYIASHTSPDDRIAVLGSEPQIYFYSKRKSATGYIYMYPLLERQPYASRMQDEAMREISAAHPVYLVFVGGLSSWSSPHPSDDRRILAWGQEYAARCYQLVGIADILWPLPSRLVWDDEVRGYTAVSDQPVLTYRRSSEAPCSVAVPHS